MTEVPFLHRGVVLIPGHMTLADRRARARQAGLNVLALRVIPGMWRSAYIRQQARVSWLAADYVARYGDPPISDYGAHRLAGQSLVLQPELW